MSDEDGVWLEVETEASDAVGSAAAAVLESIAATLDEAPDEKRYDLTLDIEERDVGGEQA